MNLKKLDKMENQCYVGNSDLADYDRVLCLYSDKNNCLQQQLFMDWLADKNKLIVFKCIRHDNKILVYFISDYNAISACEFINAALDRIDEYLHKMQLENEEREKRKPGN